MVRHTLMNLVINFLQRMWVSIDLWYVLNAEVLMEFRA